MGVGEYSREVPEYSPGEEHYATQLPQELEPVEIAKTREPRQAIQFHSHFTELSIFSTQSMYHMKLITKLINSVARNNQYITYQSIRAKIVQVFPVSVIPQFRTDRLTPECPSPDFLFDFEVWVGKCG